MEMLSKNYSLSEDLKSSILNAVNGEAQIGEFSVEDDEKMLSVRLIVRQDDFDIQISSMELSMN